MAARKPSRRGASTMPPTHPRSEHALQAYFVSLVRRLPHPVARVGYATPNGFLRTKAMRIRAWQEGMTSGVLDWHYPGPSHDGRYNSLWIEHKVGKNTLSPEQKRF